MKPKLITMNITRYSFCSNLAKYKYVQNGHIPQTHINLTVIYNLHNPCPHERGGGGHLTVHIQYIQCSGHSPGDSSLGAIGQWTHVVTSLNPLKVMVWQPTPSVAMSMRSRPGTRPVTD